MDDYKFWLEDDYFDADTKAELKAGKVKEVANMFKTTESSIINNSSNINSYFFLKKQ